MGSADPFDDLMEAFSALESGEERLELLADLGRGLPPLDASERVDANRVRGCVSAVWFVRRPSEPGVVRFDAESDALLVKGLIAVVKAAYDGRPHQEVLDLDLEGAFEKVGLSRHLSVSRRNGFQSMVRRVKEWAAR
jgi:cysteine desulfuration protein SufE